jgi:diaminohydroxyphosphoribosylaminopyrimidine deaminase / 5-amino-6-(5-phosphoribosylamino)uracil reductase
MIGQACYPPPDSALVVSCALELIGLTMVRSMTKAPSPPDFDLTPACLAAAFAQALALARAFEGATAPNPPVGCVLLDAAGAVVATGAHERAGAPHAEAAALAAARAALSFDRARVAIVTLEPCNHHGRTPPCTAALLTAPVQQIWIACRDPNPGVAGGGLERLRAEGRHVRLWADLAHEGAKALAADAERLLAPFTRHSRTGMPFVTVKQALTPSGSMIPGPGQKTFTGAMALDLAHHLRRRADAVLTGSGTIIADDPLFTVRRVADHVGKRRILVILDRRRRVMPAYLEAAAARGFDVWVEDDIEIALRRLGHAGVLEVLVEAGPALTSAVLAGPHWDEHVLIRQGARADLADAVSVIRRGANLPLIPKGPPCSLE